MWAKARFVYKRRPQNIPGQRLPSHGGLHQNFPFKICRTASHIQTRKIADGLKRFARVRRSKIKRKKRGENKTRVKAQTLLSVASGGRNWKSFFPSTSLKFIDLKTTISERS